MLTPVDRIIWAIDARETSLIIGLEKPYCSTIKYREMLITVMARPAGIEPATPGLEGRCSIRLSYGRIIGAAVILHQLLSRTKCLVCFTRQLYAIN